MLPRLRTRRICHYRSLAAHRLIKYIRWKWKCAATVCCVRSRMPWDSWYWSSYWEKWSCRCKEEQITQAPKVYDGCQGHAKDMSVSNTEYTLKDERWAPVPSTACLTQPELWFVMEHNYQPLRSSRHSWWEAPSWRLFPRSRYNVLKIFIPTPIFLHNRNGLDFHVFKFTSTILVARF